MRGPRTSDPPQRNQGSSLVVATLWMIVGGMAIAAAGYVLTLPNHASDTTTSSVAGNIGEPVGAARAADASVGMKLAVLDNVGFTESDAHTVAANAKLRRVAGLCVVPSVDRLADMLVAAQRVLLNEYGEQRSLLGLLDALDSLSSAAPGQGCAELLSLYVVTVGK